MITNELGSLDIYKMLAELGLTVSESPGAARVLTQSPAIHSTLAF